MSTLKQGNYYQITQNPVKVKKKKNLTTIDLCLWLKFTDTDNECLVSYLNKSMCITLK